MSERYRNYERLKFDYPQDRILRITISRPERLNALDAIGHRELTYVWREVDEDRDIDCVILTGDGKAFSAGGDFDMIEKITKDHSTLTNTWKEARDLVYNIINCDKPIISAINGPAVGAGLVAALLCDISISAKSVFITDGHTRLGVAAGDHAVIIWPLLCGMAKAKYYLMTCDRMPAEEAERIGLLSMCVEDGELEEKTLEVAAKLAAGAPNAIRWTKYALNNWLRMAGPSFDTSTALEMLGFAGPEGREGLAALREKRDPSFPKGSGI
ncbi:MAG: enoyl-CoA hydratase/isomerase family protein [Pseudomonadales bacterium]|jgi:enoyl-CoA hydratase|nr:enoyl-CoA hydratase/isomerase family protein [Pseudomonadales bacterium]MDP6472334.1 enoyl-CoA hydratase/isomerase family protein [Pseudomonadales bacterium]MDP6828130.1 enoyl-CoA hydratase/isomerase family protein [Pseudomonadales bacterium]MDP6971828.1 enoyl-CoA hydratase/isomerase family protein [Pseudomonadales bacterium]